MKHSGIKFLRSAASISLGKIAVLVEAKTYYLNVQVSDSSELISDIATLRTASNQDISFFSNPKYWNDVNATQAKACIISEKVFQERKEQLVKKDLYFLVVDDAYARYAQVAKLLYPQEKS